MFSLEVLASFEEEGSFADISWVLTLCRAMPRAHWGPDGPVWTIGLGYET